MANVVVAVGTVLAVLGIWAVYFGYNIVQVERGWATLIAGATLVSGGVVTAALGLVLRRLSAIQAALAPRARPRAVRVEREEPPPQLEFALVPPVSPGVDRMVEPALSQPAPHVADVPEAMHPAQAEEAHRSPPESLASDPAAYDDVDDAWRAVDAELQRTDWSRVAHAPVATPEPPLAAAAVLHEPAHAVMAPHDFEAATPHVSAPAPAAEPEPVAEAPHPPPPPFAPEHGHLAEPSVETPLHAVAESDVEDDYGDLLGQAKAEPTHEHPQAEFAAATPETAEHPAEHPVAPPVAGPAPHVIGKYDADGTTYTMFSDGSIEAHSPEGLYQFGSMAELKAFIEQGA